MFGFVLLVVTLFFTSLEGFHIQHRAKCVKKQLCNGNLMCAEVCTRGSVQVDDWIVNSLKYQSQLQRNEKLVYFEMPSTHNSAITEADGYGIEKYFISALYDGRNMDEGDDVGAGVCQYLSLTDQLRMGVRHLEIDIWWGPLEKEIQVCHSPVPLYPVGNVSRTAEERGIPLEFDPKNMSCLGTKRPLGDVLSEIRDWMVLPENTEEIVMIYYDTKFYLSPEQVNWANNLMMDIFGSMVYKVELGNPLLKYSPKDMLAMGKRIMFENQKEWWTNSSTNQTSDQIVFYPALWSHQFSADSLQEFPDCSVEGDKNWYGKQWVRALDGSFVEAATRCGVQVASGDYTNPDDMKFYVWSWDLSEPSMKDGCVALLPSGRWATVDCGLSLPYACVQQSSRDSGDYLAWLVDFHTVGPASKAACSQNYVFGAPHNGFANGKLLNAALGQMVWLNAPNPRA
jgi:hypothetical protein